MTVVIIVMLIFGAVCVGVSFFVSGEEDVSKTADVKPEGKRTLNENEKEEIKSQINELIEEQLRGIDDKTEASLDKISNTKILEMNEYADTIMNEISRNHNETVFLYDMLNEKAKEVKGTVKNVDMVQKNYKKSYQNTEKITVSQAENLNDIMIADRPEEIEKRKKSILSDGKLERNDKILKLFRIGVDEKQIAKELSMGIGEVRLVLDLYKKNNEH